MGKNKVVVAMSGGVDSAVCAYLLKKQGYDVVGMTMQIWQDMPEDIQQKEGGCCSVEAVDDARRVAEKLDIPYYVINLKELFREKVVDYFVDEYLRGRTPNPCIACNRYLKFDLLLKKALEVDAFYLATGHYAKVEHDISTDRFLLKRSIDISKDQTYALYNLTQFQLQHTLFPLGNYTKVKIRDIAEKAGLVVANKPDSQEICFVNTNYRDFLNERVPEKIKPGPFKDVRGKILGEHKGIPFYTIGQRRGLGISAGNPLYVVDIDGKDNTVILGEEKDIYVKDFLVFKLNWIGIETLDDELKVDVKIRYNFHEKPAKITSIDKDTVKVTFEEAQKAVTPGQAAVFYRGDTVVGGGFIKGRADLY